MPAWRMLHAVAESTKCRGGSLARNCLIFRFVRGGTVAVFHLTGPRSKLFFLPHSKVSISKRLGANASYAAVRVALEANAQGPAWPGGLAKLQPLYQPAFEASRAAASEWAMRVLAALESDYQIRSGAVQSHRRKPQRHAVELRFTSPHSGSDFA